MEPLVKRKIDRLCRVKGSGHYCLTVVAKASLPWASGRYMAAVIDGADCDLSRPEDLHLPTACLGRCSSDCDSVLQWSTDEKWGLQPLLEIVCVDALAGQNDPTLGDEASWRTALKKKLERSEKVVLNQAAKSIEKSAQRGHHGNRPE